LIITAKAQQQAAIDFALATAKALNENLNSRMNSHRTLDLIALRRYWESKGWTK